MASTSSSDLASELLQYCLHGRRWPDALIAEMVRRATSEDAAEASAATRALFSIVVERLADLFEPRLCDTYVEMFSDIVERIRPGVKANELRSRYSRVRALKPFSGSDPKIVYVLSRVTLGADIAVTSVVLDAMKQRFPDARIHFVGSRKNYALFDADPRIELSEFVYGRAGTLAQRLAQTPRLASDDAIVVDPDSRLTQLGLVPVCEDDRYYFLESRACGGDSEKTLQELTIAWVNEVFGVQDARAFIAPAVGRSDAEITVSFGVGDNTDKQLSEQFEAAILARLAMGGSKVRLDTGAGGEERSRAERLAKPHANVELWRGDYAPFASSIAQSALYVGYDSVGQHVAAACGVPVVTVFAGYASKRMLQRWTPSGPGRIRVVDAGDRDEERILADALRFIHELLG